MKMLILRGIAGHFAGRDWPDGALDEPPALEYARRRGYEGQVLPVAGETIKGGPQVQQALKAIRGDVNVMALYGFSGGGYNSLEILQSLSKPDRNRIRLVVILGAPKYPRDWFTGPWELVYRLDPNGNHMAGPQALLDSLPNP